MQTLKHTLLYNKIFYFAFLILLIALGNVNYLFYVFAVIFLYFMRKDPTIKLLGLFSLIFVLRYMFLNRASDIDLLNSSIKGEVVLVNDNNFHLKVKKEKVIIYSDMVFNIGDIVICTGELRPIHSSKIPYGFDYVDYCAKNQIYLQMYAKTITYSHHQFNIGTLREYIINYIDGSIDLVTGSYYKSLIFGDSSDLMIKEEIRKIGISHLFAISGLHIGLIVLALRKILKDRYICIFLLIYLLLTNFAPSVMRASLMFICYVYIKSKKLEYSGLDVLSFVFIFLMFINPNYLYNLGFQLSFLVSFSLIVSSKLNVLKITLLAQGITFPLVINITNEINIITILANLIFVTLFTFVFMPLTFITFLTFLHKIYYNVIIFFEKMVLLLASIQNTVIRFPNFTIYEGIIYYILFYFLMAKKKIFIFFLFIGLMFCKNALLVTKNVYVFDVGQGDSSLIETRNTKVMIDAFGYSYEFLRKRGIYQLDYLIITHGHNDHYSKVSEVLDSVSVNTIVISAYTENQELLDLIDGYKIARVKSGDKILTNDFTINILAPFSNSDNENNNSIVCQFMINNYTFLFMGDAEREVEELLIENYQNKLKSDVIKIGHHGSKTSSSEEFIDYVNPDEAIISVGRYNSHNLPDEEIITLLERKQIKTYITSEYNTYNLVMFMEFAYHRRNFVI